MSRDRDRCLDRNRCTSLALAVIAALAVLARPAAAEEQPGFVSEGYRFSIRAMPAPWRILDERSVRELVPDATAGVADGRGLYAVVIAEAAPAGSLDELARFLVDSMAIENRRVVTFESEPFKGLPAVRAEIDGEVNGLHVKYVSRIFLRDGYLFQVLGFGLAETVRARSFEPFFSAIELLDGAITGSSPVRSMPDTVGVGWRVRGGEFASAVYRLAAKPADRWRIAVGSELRLMSPDAEVGLVHSGPEAYVTVVAERAAGADRKAYARSALEPGVGFTEQSQTFDATVAGRIVTLHRFTLGTPPVELWRGVFFEGDICYQIVAWYMDGLRKEAFAALPAAFASLRIMDRAEADAIGAELAGAPDPQNRVGSDFALRRGVYRDFGHGFTWRKPAGFWRVLAGDEARSENPDATLVLEAPALGVFGVLVAEPVFGMDGGEYHDACVALFTDAPVHEPRPVRVGDRDALTSVIDDGDVPATVRHHVTTLVDGDLAVQLVFYGFAGNMSDSAADIDRAVQGLLFPGRLAPEEAGENAYTDMRLGYAITLPSAPWRRLDLTPTSMQPVGSFNQWLAGSNTVLVAALCALSDGQDAEWFKGHIKELARERMGALIKGEPVRRDARLGNIPAERLSWRGDNGSLDLFLCVSDQTAYALIVTKDGDAPGMDVETIAAGFTLVD